MLQTDLINQFLGKKVIAVVGVSRKGDIPANHIFRKLVQAGYHAYPVNPYADEVEGVRCFKTISELPEKAQAVMLASTPAVTDKVMDECIKSNIRYVWMHKGMGTGSFSAKAAKMGEQRGLNVIRNGCPMMFIRPVDGFHKFFSWLKRL